MIQEFKFFDQSKDIVYGYTDTVSFPVWNNQTFMTRSVPEATLSTFYTRSVDMSLWESNYYYNIYEESYVTNNNAENIFSISFGTYVPFLLYNSNTSYRYTYPSYAVYKQLKNFLTNEDNFYLPLNVSSSQSEIMRGIYIISLARNSYRDAIELNTFQLTLSGSGYYYIDGYNESSTDTVINIINYTSSIYTNKFMLVTGTSSGYTGPLSSIPNNVPIGWVYPKEGIFIIDSIKLDLLIGQSKWFNDLDFFKTYSTKELFDSAGGQYSAYTSSLYLNNFYHLLNDGKYFKLFCNEIYYNTTYYCKLLSSEFNNTTNITWYTGSDNKIRNDFYNDKTTFVSTVALYDGDENNGKAVAIAKLSRPIKKDETTQTTIAVKLGF